MEKAILKTLCYYDVFNYPLKAWEIHKWLIQKEASLSEVEKYLKKLEKKGKIKKQQDFYYLSGKKGLVKKRQQKEAYSQEFLKTSKRVGFLLRIIPWIDLIGISGSLSMMASDREDDIDLFVITKKNHLWLTRLLLIALTEMTGLRRKRREKLLKARGKICINLILENNNLEQSKKNIYVAHEVLQMRPLWQRNEIYSDFLHANSWAFKYLPNWKSTTKMLSKKLKIITPQHQLSTKSLQGYLEIFSKNIQLKIMGQPDKSERIESNALYFHPEDKGMKILNLYAKKVREL